MDEIRKLIELVKETDDIGAIYRLIEIGSQAIPAVIDELRTSSFDKVRPFSTIILEIRTPEIVPVLLELLDDKNRFLRSIAFKALGQLKDERAFQQLLDRLLDTGLRPLMRSFAARALGEFGDPKAIPGLLFLSQEFFGDELDDQKSIEKLINMSDEDTLNLMLDVAIALAKLGDHKMAQFVIFLTKYKLEADSVLRADATRALCFSVGPGMFSALKISLRDRFFEVREAALDSIFYLSTKEVIEELIFYLIKESSDISDFVLSKFYDLMGEWPCDKISVHDIKAKELEEWWKQNQKKLETGICYRFGKPICLSDLITLLKEPGERRSITEELCIITGNNFGFNSYFPARDQDYVYDHALKWWDEEGHRFEAGCLYKYGHKQNIQDIF